METMAPVIGLLLWTGWYFLYILKKWEPEKQTFNVAGYWLDNLFPKYFDLLVHIYIDVKTSVFQDILQ